MSVELEVHDLLLHCLRGSEASRPLTVEQTGRLRASFRSLNRCQQLFDSPDQRQTYIVTHGAIGRFAKTKSGMRQLLAIYLPGEIADLGMRGAGELEAIGGTAVIAIPQVDITRLMTTEPEILGLVIDYMTVETSIMARWLLNVGRLPSATRIAHLICELAHRYGAVDNQEALSFDHAFSQFDFADIAGLTAEHTNRVLQQLRAAGLILHDARRLEIPDWDQLCNFATFDPEYLGPRGARSKNQVIVGDLPRR